MGSDEVCKRANLVESINALKRKIKEIQSVYSKPITSKFNSEMVMPNSESLGLTLDFLVNEIDINFKDLTTPEKIGKLRERMAVFMLVVDWISREDDSNNIGELSNFLHTSERLLAKYAVNNDTNDENDVAALFQQKKDEIIEAIDDWVNSRKEQDVVDGWEKPVVTGSGNNKEIFSILCRNDAILIQLLKFCTKMSNEISSFPDTPPTPCLT